LKPVVSVVPRAVLLDGGSKKGRESFYTLTRIRCQLPYTVPGNPPLIGYDPLTLNWVIVAYGRCGPSRSELNGCG
ncbi:MAG: hypothetical protein ACREQA_22280, partial [Candidatus Binatia bacterium]